MFLPVPAQPHPWPAAVLVDELDAGRFQGPPNRQVVSSRHGRLAASKFGAANSCDAKPQTREQNLGPSTELRLEQP